LKRGKSEKLWGGVQGLHTWWKGRIGEGGRKEERTRSTIEVIERDGKRWGRRGTLLVKTAKENSLVYRRSKLHFLKKRGGSSGTRMPSLMKVRDQSGMPWTGA